jgi:hypothetical protein
VGSANGTPAAAHHERTVRAQADVARAYCREHANDAAKVEVVTRDWLEGEPVGTFEVGYDYTCVAFAALYVGPLGSALLGSPCGCCALQRNLIDWTLCHGAGFALAPRR